MEVGLPDTCPVILLSIRQSFVSRWDASAAMTDSMPERCNSNTYKPNFPQRMATELSFCKMETEAAG